MNKLSLIGLTPLLALVLLTVVPAQAEAQVFDNCWVCEADNWMETPECVEVDFGYPGWSECEDWVTGCDPEEIEQFPPDCVGPVVLNDGGMPAWSVTPTGVLAENLAFASNASETVDPASRAFERTCKGFVTARVFGAEARTELTRASERLSL